jgi:mono/diheme cytochrome c family protein
MVALTAGAIVAIAEGTPWAFAQGVPPPGSPPQQETTQSGSQLDVNQLFAGTCGWCHSDGGRVAGKGPKLMDTERSDDFIRNRIRNGKEGAMPAFGQMFSDADIDEIIKYIRNLKPDNG